MGHYTKDEIVDAFVKAANGLDHIHDGRDRAACAYHYLMGYFGVTDEVRKVVNV